MEMMQGEADAITRVAIDKAKSGDMTALKLVLDRYRTALERPHHQNGPASNQHPG